MPSMMSRSSCGRRGAGGGRRVGLGQDDAARLHLRRARAGCGQRLVPYPPEGLRDGYAMSEAERRISRAPARATCTRDPEQGLRMDVSAGARRRRASDGPRRAPLRRIRGEAAEWLTRVEMDWRIDESPKAFSGGMRQRLQSRAISVTRPRLVFMDEPTSGSTFPCRRSCSTCCARSRGSCSSPRWW